MVGQKVLLVEGADDEHVPKHICGNHDIGPLDRILARRSCEKLLKAIPVQAKRLKGKGDVMGVVIDADDDLERRWQAVRNRFKEAGYPDVPVAPHQDGTILHPPSDTYLPRAGVWVMPNNQVPGILEDFLLFLVPSSDRQLPHARSCVESIDSPSFKDKDKSKAVIHTWLSWQADPGKPYGTAITARFLDPDVPAVEVLVNWLQCLFD